MHIAKAKSIYETVRENCSETVLPYYYAASGANIASIYADRKFAKSEEECRANFEIALKLQNESLKLKSKTDDPEGWGILQHNMGCIYTDFCKLQDDKLLSMGIIDKAIHHLELSFQVRASTDVDAFQYWVALPFPGRSPDRKINVQDQRTSE
jgi:hypothetical protein